MMNGMSLHPYPMGAPTGCQISICPVLACSGCVGLFCVLFGFVLCVFAVCLVYDDDGPMDSNGLCTGPPPVLFCGPQE